MVELAERLAARSLGGRVYFANSGAEANEAALKLVRKARPRGEIVVLARRLPRPHLRRAVGDAAGGQAGAVRPARARASSPSRPSAAAIEAAVGERTAAVLLEPVQGESGVNLLDDDVLAAARAACDRTGAALVFDEIQTGMGRTGTLWAYEAAGVVPGRDDGRQGAGRRPADRRADHRPAARRRLRARRPRLHLRRRPGRGRRRPRRARRARRPGAAGPRPRAGRAAAGAPARAARRRSPSAAAG